MHKEVPARKRPDNMKIQKRIFLKLNDKEKLNFSAERNKQTQRNTAKRPPRTIWNRRGTPNIWRRLKREKKNPLRKR